MDDDDDGDEFEHGDAIANARNEDPSDYSVHQFLAGDDARGIASSYEETNTDGDDGAAEEVARSQAEAKDDDFGSEDTPDNSFLALRTKTSKSSKQPMDDDDDGDEFKHGDAIANARNEDPSDYSVHQFLAGDDARGIASSYDEETNADGDDGAAAEVARSQAMAKD